MEKPKLGRPFKDTKQRRFLALHRRLQHSIPQGLKFRPLIRGILMGQGRLSVELEAEEIERILCLLPQNDIIARRLRRELKRVTELEEACYSQEMADRELRIFIQEDGGQVEFLAPQKITKHRKHHGTVSTRKKRVKSKGKDVKKAIAKMSDKEKDELIASLELRANGEEA